MKDHIGRVRVIKESQDERESICICPHCGREVRYIDLFTLLEVYGCIECHNTFWRTIDRERNLDYDRFISKRERGDYEPYRYQEIKK